MSFDSEEEAAAAAAVESSTAGDEANFFLRGMWKLSMILAVVANKIENNMNDTNSNVSLAEGNCV